VNNISRNQGSFQDPAGSIYYCNGRIIIKVKKIVNEIYLESSKRIIFEYET